MKLFGSSGIRGVYGEKITADLALNLGRALGTLGMSDVVVAHDTRLSQTVLKTSLFGGLLSAGCSVTDLHTAPTPLICYGTRRLGKDAGVMITASHNPAEYNGFKLWNSEGRAFSAGQETQIESTIGSGRYKQVGWNEVDVEINEYDIGPDYAEDILDRFSLKGKSRVLIDAANGAACGISPLLLEKFGYDVVSVNATSDGGFPNRHPEPSPVNLGKTVEIMRRKKCQIGFCHDGDADRVMTIDDTGTVVDYDHFLAYICRKMVELTGIRKVVTTVDASMLLDVCLPDAEVIRTPVGDVFVANKLEEAGACFGGEPCGAYIFPEFGLWPDGIYSIFRILQFLETEKEPLSKILSRMPDIEFKRSKLPCPEGRKAGVMEEIRSLVPEDCTFSDVDGIRMDWGDSLVLIRPSGTQPIMRINAEARTRERLNSLMSRWNAIVREAIR
ncbi:MAG: phosphoglucosamine mutase [archaeon]